VVSTIDPGRKRTESENGDSLDSVNPPRFEFQQLDLLFKAVNLPDIIAN